MGRARGSVNAADGAARRGRPRAWTEERLEAELAKFLRDHRHWPSRHAFVAAGRADLEAAVRQSGGHATWARRFQLPRASEAKKPEPSPPAPKNPRSAEWTDRRLVAELVAFCGDREFFPTMAEMEAAGRSDLSSAVKRRGGIHAWAPRIGMPLRPGQDRRPYGPEDAVRDAHAVIAEHGRLLADYSLRKYGYPRLGSFIRYRCDGDIQQFVDRYLKP